MKTLYLDCGMGAAGDMLSAALLELHPEPEQFVKRLNRLGIPKVEFQAEPAVKCGITGTHMTVKVDGMEEVSTDHHEEAHHYEHTHEEYGHEHHHGEHGHEEGHSHEEHHHEHSHEEGHSHGHHHDHHNMRSITAIVGKLNIPEEVKKDILAVYDLIAQAESHVHGRPVDEIHFHEVGSMDAVADVTAVCLLMHELKPERVVASPVHVGSGHVHCAHGILPVPAPATAWILQDIPTYGGKVRGELCTPTGAALLKYFVQEFGSQPPMRVEGIGYGCGQKEFEVANCVRAMCGETADNQDYIVELRCNLDDMTPEAVGFAMEELFAAGALDVYTTAVGMKKNRPGILLTCMCKEKQREEMIRLLFLHTTTLGVRESVCNRYTLKRTMKTETTVYGNVRIKEVSGWGIKRQKAEYEDLARIAREQEMPIAQVRECVMKGEV
ncbi:MAG: nickel pincer cofactor biosynthesis protein LarC [Dorea sp.]|nr:nickel pincer cofactor biosynthesis protein LarC [Dorea sp.]